MMEQPPRTLKAWAFGDTFLFVHECVVAGVSGPSLCVSSNVEQVQRKCQALDGWPVGIPIGGEEEAAMWECVARIVDDVGLVEIPVED